MKNIIDNALEYVKGVFETDYSGHDFFHTFRVYKMATHIAIKEKANLEIVQLAALLHDVDDIKLSPETHIKKDKARSFLIANNVDETVIDTICQIIDEISYRGTDSIIPKTLEGKCVQDSDRLDAIGAIGIARAFAYGGNHNRAIYNPDVGPKLNMSAEEYNNHISTTINHFYEKLFNLKDLMNTDSAKNIAQAREMYMKDYVSEFMDEWEGIK
ncbi:MAG: HD domain-containing protein [Lachnospiraceae bacterium]|nr:HD domain-containing protein [Lachnospiraceae bacterium]